MKRLIAVEVRRDLSRRLVRVLILLAVVASIVAGVAVLIVASPDDRYRPGLHAAVLVDLWRTDRGDGILATSTVFLAIGGLIGGSSVVGGEWRGGSMAGLLTWEPRRVRVALVKIGVAAVLASLIHVVLQAVFAASMLAAVLAKGTTAGADGTWLRGVVGLVARGALVTGLAAALGASIAIIGRNTAASLGVAFGYMAVLENLLRGLVKASRPWLLGENLGLWLTARPVVADDVVTVGHSVLRAGLVLLVYATAAATTATWLFQKRDVT